MAINSRAKGIRFERALCTLLTNMLGVPVTRNWKEQTAVGGYDLEGLPRFAVEVKACKDIAVNVWWAQTLRQAESCKRIPVLFYKPMQKPWVVVFQSELLAEDVAGHLVSTTLEAFVDLVRARKLL